MATLTSNVTSNNNNNNTNATSNNTNATSNNTNTTSNNTNTTSNNTNTTSNNTNTTSNNNTKASVNTKDELIANIKEWIKIDNNITKLKTEVKEHVTKQKILTESLVSIMKDSSIDCFDINGGSLVYKQRKTRKTISGKFLLSQLEEYYKGQPDLAKEIAQKVLDNRSEVLTDEIKRKIYKN